MSQRHDQDRVWDLVDSIKFAMLVTHDGDGDQLRARPMHAHGIREEDTIYFLTDRRHHKDDEIQVNENVCLAFADTGGQRYLSITGTATVLDDRKRVHELWSPTNKAFWDDENDPNIRVLRVRPGMAEFWDSPGRIVTTVKMAAAALTGAKIEFGENRKVVL
ncbi:pyridoxamine 5'-phosphate oxidase family protein [Bosea sp. BH3]|uniref:pyridoxamine 5'-phosphate oxidase family protein n=1 Tax=Bosea sp. BH3 TaxID=2871701 RepID=UPI0021CB305F|nr:pyridoxamine 5'-phosphate oxidase family protein [Bosea sp. BH3]MCU4180071.1 pyridoxamine 5'-phosphate oxidase family protein [Bosea sp. BH3]